MNIKHAGCQEKYHNTHRHYHTHKSGQTRLRNISAAMPPHLKNQKAQTQRHRLAPFFWFLIAPISAQFAPPAIALRSATTKHSLAGGLQPFAISPSTTTTPLIIIIIGRTLYFTAGPSTLLATARLPPVYPRAITTTLRLAAYR